MKQKLILVIIAAFATSFMIVPKTSAIKFRHIPFFYSFYSVEPKTGSASKKLEGLPAAYQAPKGKATSATYTIAGTKSVVRLKIAEAVFQSNSDPATGTLDPASYIGLYKLSVGKSTRTFEMNANGTSTSMMLISFTSLEQLSRRIAVTGAILPGEYAFVDRTTTDGSGNVTVWCFGID